MCCVPFNKFKRFSCIDVCRRKVVLKKLVLFVHTSVLNGLENIVYVW